ncbi:hypothetical protein NHQ30_010696 [Ciborinia camelliae]|nr:hypothetical protein NHQ30_010696 [Ciborinia camelliae]
MDPRRDRRKRGEKGKTGTRRSGPISCHQKVEAFVETYKKPPTQKLYRDLANFTHNKCETMLKTLRLANKGFVQSRVKTPRSLEKKLGELVQSAEFRDWVTTSGENLHRHPEMGDLAGVRIGLYLADDIELVHNEITKHYHVKHNFGTVTGGRDVVRDRNLDVKKHVNGPWHSANRDGTTTQWQHSGYKSWQLVVRLQNPKNALEAQRVEIQLSTVAMQSWGEMQHSIIYKNPKQVPVTPAIRNVIDAMNGLSIMNDQLGRQLKASMGAAEQDAEARNRRRFRSPEQFSEWFEERYVKDLPPWKKQRWVVGSDAVKEARRLFRRFGTSRATQRQVPCAAFFAEEIAEGRFLLRRPVLLGKKWDISVLLMRALGLE